MTRRFMRALGALAAGGALALTIAAPTAGASEQLAAPDYTGIIKLSNCSGALVKLPSSAPTDPALAMTNGHCNEYGFPAAGEVQVNRPSSRSMTLLGNSGQVLGTLRASKIAISTMTDTDLTLYQLTSTYQQISDRMGGKALEISSAHPTAGSAISVVSGYFTRTWSCNIDKFVYRLREGAWTWKDSIRYTSSCDTIHGTSGSPIIDNASKKVVGINNTGNDDGQRCTENNPCEVDQNGKVTYQQGLSYGQETYQIAGCMGSGNQLNLNKQGCALPKPTAVRAAA